MRKASLQTLCCAIVLLLAACGGSPTSPTSAPAQTAPLSIYFSAFSLTSATTLYALNASDGSTRWSYQAGQVSHPVVG